MNNLREHVFKANIELVNAGLVVLTWGNASGLDCKNKQFAIKPSGVDYSQLTPNDIVMVSVEDGEGCDGDLSPSSDTPTHLELYRAFDSIGGVVHTHSPYATAWAQAARPIPCLGTTHADTFYGEVPLCRQLTEKEVEDAYEINTGKAIAEHFINEDINPIHVPGVLVPGHGPFTWGKDADEAVKNAVILEEVAKMAHFTLNLKQQCAPLKDYVLNKHFSRKHGPDAYYGQK